MVVVVAPALNTRLRHWTSDVDGARAAAADRLDAWLTALDRAGVPADGWVGDADPLLAIDDALAVVPADELLIATPPEPRANWLARDLAACARERFALPVAELVVAPADRAAPTASRARAGFRVPGRTIAASLAGCRGGPHGSAPVTVGSRRVARAAWPSGWPPPATA